MHPNSNLATDYKSVSVLLIEDDVVDIMGVKREFERSGFHNPVLVAHNGLEALDLLRNGTLQNPYLIMLDLNMPKMNGIEFLKEVRMDEKLQNSVIFVFTTSNDNIDKKHAYEHNIAGYLLKDRNSGGFFNAVDLLSRYAQVVELPQ